MKILILGGSRFIGYLTLCRLVNDGHDVTVFNRQITAPPEPFPKRVRFITGNRATRNSLASVFLETTFDVIIDISGYTKNDVEYVLEHCANKIGHYIFISSPTVYDSPVPYRVSENSPKIDGLNTAAKQKIDAENVLARYGQRHNLHFTILRPHGVFGRFDPCQCGQILYRLHSGLPIIGHGSETARLNPVYVEDVVTAIVAAISNKMSYGKAYNVAGDIEFTLREFVALCESVSGHTGFLNYSPNESEFYQYGVDFKRHAGPITDWTPFDFVCSNSRIKADLGVTFTPPEFALQQTHLWLQRNPKALNYFRFQGERPILTQSNISRLSRIQWMISKQVAHQWAKTKVGIKAIPYLHRLVGPRSALRAFGKKR